MAKWQVIIDNPSLGGYAPYAPAFNASGYESTYGNKNQAQNIVSMDLTNPNYMKAGPTRTTLTNGTQAAAFTTLMKGVLDFIVASDVTYGTGGNKVYKLSSTAVTSDGTWPHTIDKAAVTAELGEDVALFQGALYYSYNHSGSLGDIGKFDLASTFDDDYMSTVPTGMNTLTGGVSHQMVVGGNDVLYIANGRFVSSFDGTTFIQQALDLPVGTVIQSIRWNSDRLWISTKNPDIAISSVSKIQGSIYVWDGTTNSWELEIKLGGAGGALLIKNGTLFIFYQDIRDSYLTGSFNYKLGYVNGTGITDLLSFTESFPSFYQVTSFRDFIMWTGGSGSTNYIWCFGSGFKDLPTRYFPFANVHADDTTGALATPFGIPMVATTQGSGYRLDTMAGTVQTASTWTSKLFDITGTGRVSKIDAVRVNFTPLTTDLSVAVALIDNSGRTLGSTTISFAKLGAATTVYYPLGGKVAENFSVHVTNSSNVSLTDSVEITGIKVYGTVD